MEEFLLRLAGRVDPRLARARGRERAVGLAGLFGVLYGAPVMAVAVVWLVASTDLSTVEGASLPFLIIFVLVYLFRRLAFTSYVEIEPGVFGTFGGSVDDIVRWSGALLFGPPVLWVHVFWRSVEFVRDFRRSDLAGLRWDSTRQFILDAGGDALAGLLGLALYVRLGGVHPPPALSVDALAPAVYATAVRFIVPVALGAPYLAFLGRSPSLSFGFESRRALLRFSVISSVWPLLVAPFAVFAAGLYVAEGPVAWLFLVAGALLASLLAHRMSKAVAESSERTRELRSMERLGRAIVEGPPDASSLPELLREHVAGMFVMSTVDIRLFPDRDLLHEPEYAELPNGAAWEWIQAAGATFASPAGRRLPWGETPRSHGVVLVPILDTETSAVIGGIIIRKRMRPDVVTDVLPAAQSLAAQISSALHGARVYRQALEHMRVEEELAVAADMQANLMPASAPRVAGWEFKAIIDSAREASGDFIDFIPLSGGKWGVLVADVSGKGIAAALYMAMVRTLIRTYAYENEDAPERVFASANRRILLDTNNDSFVTAFYGVLHPDSGLLRYSNAGHNAPFLLHAAGGVEELGGTGIPLGMLEDASWELREATVLPGDRLLAFTDGATDAQNDRDEPFGERRLLAVAKTHASETAVDMRTAVFEEIKRFVGDAAQEDDITLMVVARAAGAGASGADEHRLGAQ